MTRRQLRARQDSLRSVPTVTLPARASWCCSTCRHYPDGGRMRGVCALTGQMVYGESVRGCWRPRGEVQP